ncbi:hypothetical protein [Algoriphagus boritolerans]|uniref:hypothetical protein n=1 Tax=Algoriphagus boritolerans TaxID=308111 RepID=UPI002FCE1A50
MAYAGLSELGWDSLFKPHVLIPGLLTSLMLWGNYPLTQVYQHREDTRRGDQTLSITLDQGDVFLLSGIFRSDRRSFCLVFFRQRPRSDSMDLPGSHGSDLTFFS